MAINMRDHGIMIFKMVTAHILTQMAMFIVVNGAMADPKVMATIFTPEERLFTKENGDRVKNKGLVS